MNFIGKNQNSFKKNKKLLILAKHLNPNVQQQYFPLTMKIYETIN